MSSSGADLFVVCKQCGAEVSPYITECPYCGNRLRRRAPKLPRERTPLRRGRRGTRHTTHIPSPSLRRLRRGEIPGIASDGHPYATIALVLAGSGLWVAWHAGAVGLDKLVVIGALHHEWWRLITTQFAFANGFYAISALAAVAVFGWLLERRHGPAPVLALFLGAGVAGALAALAIYPNGLVSGGNGAALALVAAWAARDLLAATGGRYEGDLLGAAAFGALLLAMPAARVEASWVAGLAGGLIGLLVGAGLARLQPDEV